MIDRRVKISPGPTSHTATLSGYVAGYEPYYWPPGAWTEEIPRTVFEEALSHYRPLPGLAIETSPNITLVTSWQNQHTPAWNPAGNHGRGWDWNRQTQYPVAWNKLSPGGQGALQVDVDDIGLKIEAIVTTSIAEWAQGTTLAPSFHVFDQTFSMNATYRLIHRMAIGDILIAHEPQFSIWAQEVDPNRINSTFTIIG